MKTTKRKELAVEMGVSVFSISKYISCGMPYVSSLGVETYDIEECKAWKASMKRGALTVDKYLYGYKTISTPIQTFDIITALAKEHGVSRSKMLQKCVEAFNERKA